MENHKSDFETLSVQTTNGSYPIYLGYELLIPALIQKYAKQRGVFVVTDQNVYNLYSSYLTEIFSELSINLFILQPGEENKSSENLLSILQSMVESKLNRDSLVVAFGGGVVGDIAGFAASCYQRGIPLVQIPTTLLSQVDSSVGGKTAINFCAEKNVVGAFYQPKAVLIDYKYLQTLPQREFIAGMAEVIKYGLIHDQAFFDWLECNSQSILDLSSEHLAIMLTRCCEIKAEIVSADETEQGIRAILNLGHTFGHALESVTDYKRWLHGEAVAIGIVCQALLAKELYWLSLDEVERILAILRKFRLPVSIPNDIDLDSVLQLMYRDKKVLNSNLRLILNRKIGTAEIHSLDNNNLLIEVLKNAAS